MFSSRGVRLWGLERFSQVTQEKEAFEAPVWPSDARLFNEEIGNPIHPKTGLPSPLLQYQLDVIECRHKNMQVVKSNKIGITEAILRRIIQKSVDVKLPDNYVGFQVMLGAQVHELAVENLSRIASIFLSCEKLRGMLDGDPLKNIILLKNGTELFTMPASANAIRGYPRVKAVYLDEAAHYGMLDDTEILAAALSRLTNTEGDLIVSSTPKGTRGFFYQRYMAAKQGANIWVREYPYHVALGKLISQEFIDEAKKQLGPLFPQEYECQWLSGASQAFPPNLLEGLMGDFEAEEL